MDIKEVVANSHLAFLNQENELALQLAQEAINMEGNYPNAYKCAANALMSLERYDEAVKNYRMALKYDPANGNRYYDLGFALATHNKLADALKYLAKADELGCGPENLVQLYNLLGIICFEIRRYDDALVNFEKAEQLAGIDIEILQRKAIIYGMRNEVRKGLEVTNQIKMVAPSEYMGYQMAFQLLVQSKRWETAAQELQKAARYAGATMELYFDMMTLELELYNQDKDPVHYVRALQIIEQSLIHAKPEPKDLVDAYINAAEIYLQLEEADRTLECLAAAQAPAAAYKNGFAVLELSAEITDELDADTMEAMLEEDREMLEEYDDDDLEELLESADPDDEDFLTDLGEAYQEDASFEPAEDYEIPAERIEQINRLYIGAYTLKKDFEKVIEYARILQAGEGAQNTHIGRYAEANAYLQMGSEETAAKYAEAIKFFRNAMIKDPTDLIAVNFRIQCCTDIGDYAEAERICGLLAPEVRKPLLEKIEQAKAGGA